jgi:hypothetical protein
MSEMLPYSSRPSDLREQTNRLTSRIAIVVIFSIAMAWMESSTVVYLRTLVNRIEPYQQAPLPIINSLGVTEIIREAATLILLLTIGWLAGTSWRSRLGFFMAAFGVWDIFYYLFLKVIVGWPHSLFDWDVLFLIPLPWWGPVLSPILISVVLIFVGSLLAQNEINNGKLRFGKGAWSFHICGISMALYVFMAHSIEAVGKSNSGVENLPIQFNWPLFILSIFFMLAPVFEVGMRTLKSK